MALRLTGALGEALTQVCQRHTAVKPNPTAMGAVLMFTTSTSALHGATDTDGMYSTKEFASILAAAPVVSAAYLKYRVARQLGKKKSKQLATDDYENLVIMIQFVQKGMTEALQINSSTGAAAASQADQNMFYGTKFVDSGVRVDDKTVFCHDAYNKNRWACPMQIAINIMLEDYTAAELLV